MTKITIEQQLKKQLMRLENNKSMFLKYQNKLLDGGDTRDSLLDYILSSEQLAIHARSLPNIGDRDIEEFRGEFKRVLPVAHDITVSLLPEGWVYLTMDVLLPSKGQKIPREFILYPLTYALEKFQKEQLYEVAYSRTTIVVRHVYNEHTPLGLIRDNDNIETKTLRVCPLIA